MSLVASMSRAVAPGRDPVTGILAVRRLDDTHARRHALQSHHDVGGVLVAGRVPIGDHHHPAPGERLAGAAVYRVPLARAAGVARRGEPDPLERVDILLALDDVHHARGVGRAHPIQAVQHAPGVAERLDPAPWRLGIRPPLAKVLGIEPHDLKHERAGLVAVVVLRSDA
jgi:hypothetical protein